MTIPKHHNKPIFCSKFINLMKILTTKYSNQTKISQYANRYF